MEIGNCGDGGAPRSLRGRTTRSCNAPLSETAARGFAALRQVLARDDVEAIRAAAEAFYDE